MRLQKSINDIRSESEIKVYQCLELNLENINQYSEIQTDKIVLMFQGVKHAIVELYQFQKVNC